MHWLSNCSKPWLLILDNADDPDMDVSKYFPAGNRGHILITTRNPGVVEYATVGNFRFQGMDPEEAVRLLLRSAHMIEVEEKIEPHNEAVARDIAFELGYLALALTQAGAAIRRKIYTLERYLYYYLGLRKETISGSYVTTAEDANIITTWEIPFQKLSSRQSLEHRYAVELLHIFAFMHFESIPESLLRRVLPAGARTRSVDLRYPKLLQEASNWSEDAFTRFRRALRILSDHSIIDHDPDKGLCTLHPVVHQWARARLSPSEQRYWASWSATILVDNVSSLSASELTFRRALIPHVDACVLVLNKMFVKYPGTAQQADELSIFAQVYAENGLWEQARKLQKSIIAFRSSEFGKFNQTTIQTERDLAFTLWNLFEIRPAIEIQVSVLKKQWWKRPSLGYWTTMTPWKPVHTRYCIALNDLTLSLWLAGRRELSKRAGERALGGLLERLGPDDPLTIDAMFNLGRTYLHLKELLQAHSLLATVVQKRKRLFGPEHPDTLMARNELGLSFRALGKLKIAERLIVNVLQSRKRILGEDHAYTMWSINDYSKVLCDQGKADEAVLMLEKLLPHAIRILGERHVGIMMTRSNLARAHSKCQNWEKANELFLKIIPAIPPEHPDWIHARCACIHVQSNLEKPPATLEQDCLETIEAVRKERGTKRDDPRLLGVGQVLLRLYKKNNRADEVITLKKRNTGLGDVKAEGDKLLAVLNEHQKYVKASEKRPTLW